MFKGRVKNGELYLVIGGTNRMGGYTESVAEEYVRLLRAYGIEPSYFNLGEFDLMDRNDDIIRLENDFLIPATKFIFVVPEYNGSYPGILKLMIDDTDYLKVWPHKKALLTGIATGRAGNLRGMDHLSDTLQFLKVTVHYNKLPISKIHTLYSEDGLLDDETLSAMKEQLHEFILF